MGVAEYSDHPCLYDSVMLSVGLHDKKWLKLKSPNTWHRVSITIPCLSVSIRLKCQVHKVQKGDQVAGVSYALYGVPRL